MFKRLPLFCDGKITMNNEYSAMFTIITLIVLINWNRWMEIRKVENGGGAGSLRK